jgi:RNA polymerase sigma-70 factor (ECF subfamily)
MVRLGDRTTAGVSFETVLAAAQSDTAWALGTLWRTFAPAVHGFLRSRGSREAEDLTSEVFMTVFDQLGTFRGGEAEFRSFLFTIAYRRLTDELRQRSRRGEAEQWSPESDPRLTASAEETAEAQLGEAAAIALIDALPVDQREVMTLRILADLTVEQIAQVLGKRAGAVKALQRRALENLRKKVSDNPYPSAALER